MKQYSVKGKFEVEFSRIVEAETEVEAEETVAGTYRRILNNEFNVPGRPYDVRVEEVIYDQRTQNCD